MRINLTFGFAIFILSLIFLFGIIGTGVSAKINTLKEYENSINYSCNVDSDCEIKDVGNCCGYYPECVNKNAVVNRSLVAELCKEEKTSGVCGFPSYDTCKCESKKCKGKNNEGKIYCEDYPTTPDCVCKEGVKQQLECDAEGELGCSAIVVYNCVKRTCPEWYPAQCIKGSELVSQGNNEEGCPKKQKCVKTLSNGRNAEIKIMPETASQRAIERLGQIGFNISLKEVGKGDETKAVYEVSAEKDGRIFGLFKKKAKVSVEVDAETGEVVKVKRPWWAFLASGV